ncbi:MAG: TetR/AcrR family transcriptional regulator [Deltaproteobacteria bacterium]|nr:TetR/AcrR family transcriptional regulator [Deltaproteobacteria bacterium]
MKKEDRRIHVLECASEVFAKKGYHETSVSDIVERARIARGTFYLYFENKRAIFEELLDQLIEKLDRRIKRINPEDDVARQLKANVRGIIDLFLDNRELTKILVHEAIGLDEGFDKKLAQLNARIRNMVKASLDLGIEMGILRPCNTSITARCIMGSVREVINYLVVEAEPGSHVSGKERDSLVEQLMAFSLFGLSGGSYNELNNKPLW